MEVRCISTGVNVISDDKAVRFKCPACADTEIVRSGKARVLKMAYKCPECGFEGP